jgi:molybdopterin/thiamine biosynthesis adenylyltransferase/nitroreductase
VNRSVDFPYDLAFSRNLGFVTDFEQLALRAKRVAIAGMGGVGGVHLLTLARLGIGAFTIADADHFEFVNFNRQVGATLSTVGREKTAVLEEMARAINPELRIRRFDHGVAAETIDDFLRDADLFVDGLDFFELRLRRLVFARCAALRIPALTAAPIGMGVALILFHPDGMSFDRYFQLDGHPEREQHVRFLLGLSPKIIASRYLIDPTRVDLARHKGPSTIVACQLCAGFTATAAVQMLLRRPGLRPAPYNYQFDPYTASFHRTRLVFGNAGLSQRLKLAFARRQYTRTIAEDRVKDATVTPRTDIEEILNLARWAPSGDNSQPWRFRVLDPETVRVMIRHESGNVYEYRNGEPTWLTAGILVETARIAATGWQRTMQWHADNPGRPDVLLLRFSQSASVQVDPLFSFITLRSVDRRRYRFRRLEELEKIALRGSMSGQLRLDWAEDLGARWRFARLAAASTGIRLRCPEAFPVHRRVIDWDHALSPEGIPSGAVGLPRVTLPLMRLAMGSWERARWLNRLDGTLSAQLHMDILPGLASAAWFVMRRPQSSVAATPMELIEIGRDIQRFWLTASRLGLAIQPTLAPLGFSHYGESGNVFSSMSGLSRRAERLASYFRRVLGFGTEDVVFMGRIGEPRPRLTKYRSVRRPLEDMWD